MALAALIGAYQEVRDGDALRATLPIAGHALIEHQVRQAVQAGAATVVLLVERVPAPLTAAIDRLRRGGIVIEVARSVSDAADRVHPEERLLVLADGLIADQYLIDRVVQAGAPCVLVVPDEAEHRRLERIDGISRWGGLLLTDGTRLRSTAAMLGEWDLISTLLRRTMQESPRRLEAAAGVSLVDTPSAIDEIRETLLLATRGRARGWCGRVLHAPIEELAVPPLLRASIDPLSVRALAIASTLVAALAFFLDWRAAGLVVLLLAGSIDAVARRLGRLRLHPLRADDPGGLGRTGARLVALAALGASLARGAGWGAWTIAAGLAIALAALAGEGRLADQRHSTVRRPLWLADEDAVVVAVVPFALAGDWLLGLAVALGYALVSFFRVQRGELRVARVDRAV